MKKPVFYLAIFLAAKGFAQVSAPNLHVIKEKAQAFVKQQSPQHKQASMVSLKDSTYYYSWNFGTLQWAEPSRGIYGYDAAGKENSVLHAYPINGAWQDNSRQINYTFDANKNVLGYELQKWNVSVWVNNEKNTYTYDNANNQLTGLNQHWNSTTSSWENYSSVTNTYDASQNRLSSVNQVWNPGTGAWLNVTKETFTYSTNHQYISSTYESWNSSTSAWESDYLYTNFVYTNGDLISVEGKVYDAGTSSYITVYQVTNTYDGSHHLMNATSQELDFGTMTMENADKDDYTYDSNDNQVTYLNQRWNTATNGWGNVFRQYDYYSYKTVGLNSGSKKDTNISLYPNPAKGEIRINSSAAITAINVIDVTGKTVLTETPADSRPVKLDVSSLPQGVYVVEVKSGNATTYKKMIKE